MKVKAIKRITAASNDQLDTKLNHILNQLEKEQENIKQAVSKAKKLVEEASKLMDDPELLKKAKAGWIDDIEKAIEVKHPYSKTSMGETWGEIEDQVA